MANISNKAIIATLEEANRWLTFEELVDTVPGEYNYLKFHTRLRSLAERNLIQYIDGYDPISHELSRSYYGRIGLEKGEV